MSDINDLYEEFKVKVADRVPDGSKVILVAPTDEYDASDDLSRLEFDEIEVTLVYPRIGMDFLKKEIALSGKLCIRVGGMEGVDCPDIGSVKRQDIDVAIGDKFVNLRHHDEYTMREGLGKVKDMAKVLKKSRRSFCSITNVSSISGWIQQHLACKSNSIKSIYGIEVFVNDKRDHVDKTDMKADRENNTITMIAKTEDGYYNIIKMHNDAQLYGFNEEPRCNHESFEKLGGGVIGISSGFSSEINIALMSGDGKMAVEIYKKYDDYFDEFYLDLVIADFPPLIRLNERIIRLAEHIGAKLIVSCNSFYMNPDHKTTYNLLMDVRNMSNTINFRKSYYDLLMMKRSTLSHRNGSEIREIYNSFTHDFGGHNVDMSFRSDIFTEDILNEAIENSRRIAISTEHIKMDSALKLPVLFDDSESELRKKAWEGFKMRKLSGKEYEDRLNEELDIICSLEYADYFLMTEKIIAAAVNKFGDLSKSFGRGSAAGSLVSYCLDITELDPIQYGLLFERFLDYSRSPVNVCTFEV